MRTKFHIEQHVYKWAAALARRIGKPPGITVHNSGSDAKHTTVDDIHRWHLANGWAGFGYHAAIFPDGRIVRGRPIWAMGAHCLGHNDWLGVVFIGNWDVQKTMPDAQIAAGRWLIHRWREAFDIPKSKVKPHRSMPGNSTGCPGKNFPFSKVVN